MRPSSGPTTFAGMLPAATAWVLVSVAASCSSHRETTGPSGDPATPGLIVSSLSVPRNGVEERNVASLTATVAYVSLASGTTELGWQADIRNVTTGLGTSTAMQDGGFDPVPLPADEGDAIEVIVHEADGGTQRFTSTARLFRRPVVVRTGPARGAVDVPLNSLIIIVFSEPMDPETVEGAGMELIGPGGLLVPLAAELGADGLTAEVSPEEPLVAGSTYTLVVDSTATSTGGIGLGNTYQTEFSTTAVQPMGFVVGFGPEVDTAQVGTSVRFGAEIQDLATGEVFRPEQWFSLDLSIARVDGSGLVYGIGAGDVEIVARFASFGTWSGRVTFTAPGEP